MLMEEFEVLTCLKLCEMAPHVWFLASPKLIKGCFIEPLLQRNTQNKSVLFGAEADKAVDQWFSLDLVQFTPLSH